MPRTGVLPPHAYFSSIFFVSLLLHPPPHNLPLTLSLKSPSARYIAQCWLYEGRELHYSTVMPTDHTGTQFWRPCWSIYYSNSISSYTPIQLFVFTRQYKKNTWLNFQFTGISHVESSRSFVGNVLMIWFQVKKRRAACGRSPAEIVGSNPTGGMDICLLWVSCVVR